jgi:uncharacterized membrane protein
MGHLHLMVNHFPLAGLLFAIALLGFGMLKNSDHLKLAAVWSILFVAVTSIISYSTGEYAEDMLENALGATEQTKKALEPFIHAHETAGLFLLVTTIIAGLIAAYCLVVYGKSNALNDTALKVLMAVAVFTLLIAARTSQLGGQIRHTETRTVSAIGDTLRTLDNNRAVSIRFRG